MLGNSDGTFRARHALASSVDGSGVGMISMDGTETAMIKICVAISATYSSVTMNASRDFLRP